MPRRSFWSFVSVSSAACFLLAASSFAQSSSQDGKLKIHVSPKQAYVFVDGKAIRDGSQTISLAPGDHKVGVYNYGYQPKTENISISAHKTTDLTVHLQASGDRVSGPFADIEFKGDPRAAVLLNGDSPSYFVGHVDEFDWDWIWHQRLLVHPGTYNVSATQKGNTVWSGPVTVKAGQKAIVDLNHNGKITMKEWKEGLNMSPQPRFHAGVASALIPIAPVTAQLSAQSSNLSCGQSTSLNWNSANAVDTSVSGIGTVSADGSRSVSPTKNTTYVLTAKGPGGDVTQSIMVDVSGQPAAMITVSQPDVRYHKIGDKVVEQGSATLNWSASNASSATISPFGTEPTTGSRSVTADPTQTATGPVNQDVTYTLMATNACGTATKTATLHITGSIDPAPPVTLASMFYPTAYPTRRHPKDGLVASERATLNRIATKFNDHEQYDRKGTLVILAHADVRGSRTYNQALSERRAALVKDYLVSHNVPASKIDVRAEGKDQQLDQKKVEALQSQDPEKPEKWMTRSKKHKRTTWLAYNRRADIILEPTGTQSNEAYPNDVADARILWQLPEPSLKAVQHAERMSGSSASLSASTSGN
ncbi:MAG TPA: OmpA family protein [Candidatus Methylomirabilis sp.]|nr:OmpA family protein [Candidatus Methylomirabilis sp.]